MEQCGLKELRPFFRKIATIVRELEQTAKRAPSLYLYCERNLGRGQQSTDGAGVGEGYPREL